MIGHYLAQLNLVGDPLVGEVGIDALRNLLGIGPDIVGENCFGCLFCDVVEMRHLLIIEENPQ